MSATPSQNFCEPAYVEHNRWQQWPALEFARFGSRLAIGHVRMFARTVRLPRMDGRLCVLRPRKEGIGLTH